MVPCDPFNQSIEVLGMVKPGNGPGPDIFLGGSGASGWPDWRQPPRLLGPIQLFRSMMDLMVHLVQSTCFSW